MATLCLYIKPTATRPGTRLMSVTRLGPEWTGRRLRLREPGRVGLREADLVGWSDFYAGSPCDVHVAFARDGERSGWLVWGGTLGLRSLPPGVDDPEAVRGGGWDEPPVLWIDDASLFPEDVRAVVTTGSEAGLPAGSGEVAGEPLPS